IERLQLRQAEVLAEIKKKDEELEKLIHFESTLDANIKVLLKELGNELEEIYLKYSYF
ncbi:unnamed protein product, partial [Adineta steineri]